MPYATQQDFIDAFGEVEAIELTNLDNAAATSVNAPPLTKALTDASATIDAYVGARYVLPLSVVPAPLDRHCLDIARYYLDRIRSREDVRARYDDAIKFLTSVAKGTVSLGGDLISGQNVSSIAPSLDASGARSYACPPIDLGGF